MPRFNGKLEQNFSLSFYVWCSKCQQQIWVHAVLRLPFCSRKLHENFRRSFSSHYQFHYCTCQHRNAHNRVGRHENGWSFMWKARAPSTLMPMKEEHLDMDGNWKINERILLINLWRYCLTIGNHPTHPIQPFSKRSGLKNVSKMPISKWEYRAKWAKIN